MFCRKLSDVDVQDKHLYGQLHLSILVTRCYIKGNVQYV